MKSETLYTLACSTVPAIAHRSTSRINDLQRLVERLVDENKVDQIRAAFSTARHGIAGDYTSVQSEIINSIVEPAPAEQLDQEHKHAA